MSGMEGGVFAVIEDGDTITVDIPNRSINLNVDEETIQKRLAIARVEAKEVPKYDYIILNDAVENAVAQVFAVLDAARCRTQGRMDLLEDFKGE